MEVGRWKSRETEDGSRKCLNLRLGVIGDRCPVIGNLLCGKGNR